jgi:hypothetical protein
MNIEACCRVTSIIHMLNDTSYLMSIAMSLVGAFASYAIQERRYSLKYLAVASV